MEAKEAKEGGNRKGWRCYNEDEGVMCDLVTPNNEMRLRGTT